MPNMRAKASLKYQISIYSIQSKKHQGVSEFVVWFLVV
jgi:hypothetical protein